jgi:hypothetical protein
MNLPPTKYIAIVAAALLLLLLLRRRSTASAVQTQAESGDATNVPRTTVPGTIHPSTVQNTLSVLGFVAAKDIGNAQRATAAPMFSKLFGSVATTAQNARNRLLNMPTAMPAGLTPTGIVPFVER